MSRRRCFVGALGAAAVIALAPAFAQPAGAQGADAKAKALASRPIPRLPDGKPSFEAPPGEKGVWNRQDYRGFIPTKPEEIALRDRGGNDDDGPPGLKIKVSDVPFQPWAYSLWLWRQEHEIEPYARCKPAGGMRNMAVPYGTEFVHVPEQQKLYIFQTGGSHTFRTIHIDGRPHPKDLDPSYAGHASARWEGDTLVVDTVGFNERGWLDAYGLPTTKQHKLTERFTRLDFRTLRYEMTVDDPGAYTAPFKTGMLMTFQPDREQFEFVCQDGNLASELMIGSANEKIDRTSSIVP